MKFSDLVCFDAMVPQLESSERDGVISELVSKLGAAGKLGKAKAGEITKAVIKRENEASTGIGKGVAVPHVKHKAIKDVVAAVGCSSAGIDFSSLDKQPVYSVILLLSPEGKAEKHLQAMETIFKNLQKDDFRRFLRQATTVENIKDVILEADENSS
jgi:mannitol/fructose-specific phosphotransferase system IIA component (Ntr-type)